MNLNTIEKIRKIGKNIKVLYVEDDLLISKQIQKLLLKLFSNVTHVKDGIEALEIYNTNKYDIVITDITMPEMDGITMSKKIKRLNEDQIIIVISAYSDSDKLIELIEFGVDKFIMKPIDVNLFLNTIVKIVINIYNQKRKIYLEEKEKKDIYDKNMFLDGMIAPVTIIERGTLCYINENFKNKFNVYENYTEYNLCELFKDKALQTMANTELIQYLSEHQNNLHSIMVNNEIQNYNIKITKIKHSLKTMCCFFNLEDISSELNRLKSAKDESVVLVDSTTGLFLRDTFKYNISQLVTNDIEYSAICFGLKYKEEYVKKFGVSSLQKIYKKFGQYLVHNFLELLNTNVLELYCFDANKFVLLVQQEYFEEVDDSLKSFGYKYSYFNKQNSTSQMMTLDKLFYQIDKKKSLKSIMSNIENNLYMLVE